MKNNKSLGQHWLKDRIILDSIAALTADQAKTDFCLEIGPGLGTLTSSLLKHFSTVEAVEFDERLAKNLPKSFPGKNLIVKNQDFLKYDLDSIQHPYVVAGNIPYYITSPIIEKLLSAQHRPQKIVLLIQKEVAERISAIKGRNSVLSLMVQNLATVTLGDVVPKEYFTPPPKVDSQIIILTPKNTPEITPEALDLARRGFRMPRKKLTANLSNFMGQTRESVSEALNSLNIDKNARAEDLSLQNWQDLLDIFNKSHNNCAKI